MKQYELDDWFFDLPACQQMDITGIFINEDEATDVDYELFDNAVGDWWYSLTYEEKRDIYKNETK